MKDEGKIYYPLTHPQLSIWYTEKVHPDTSVGNVAATLRIKGEVNYALLEQAVNLFIMKNDGIRIRVVGDENGQKQYIADYSEKKLDVFDFTNSTIEELYKWDEQQSYIPFNLIDSDLFYFALVKINENDGGFLVKLHHLVSDAWTMSLVGNEIMEYYCALKKGEEVTKESNPSYIDYIKSEQEYIKSDKYQSDREYWHNKFEGLDELTVLKTRTTNELSTKSRRKTFVTPHKFTQKLYKYCKENKSSVFTCFLSGLSLYVNRVMGKEDLILGTVVLNRSNFREKNTTGMYISTVPLRINVNDTLNFNTFEKEISRDWMGVLRHQRYPYDVLLKEIREKNSINDNLYDIVLSYQNAKFTKDEHLEEYETRWHFNGYQTNSLTININDREDEGHLIIDYDYHVDLYHATEIEFIHQHIINLLWHALDNTTKEVRYLDILSEKERHKILYEFNDTVADYPKDKTIHQLFEEQVERTPDNIALVFEDNIMTYKELNQKSNQLARILRDKGVKPDSIVGIMVNRSLEMMVGMLAILKSGGCYLPIDPDYPEERIEYMIEDSNANILLTQSHLKNKLNFAGEMICIDEDLTYTGDNSNLDNINKPNDLAYMIYTSGSTGKPKGVMIEHRNVTNYITGVSNIIGFSPNKTIISVTTISFDIFVTESLTSLLKGLKIVIANEEEQRLPRALNEVILKNKVNMIQTTPSRIQLMISDEDSLECFEKLTDIMVGGEALPTPLLEQLKSLTKAKIYNMYGPTETTVWSTIKDLTEQDEIDIGKPIVNTQIFILDKNQNLVPIGILGELCIGGEGLTRGYYNRAELTNEKYIPNPFHKGELIYKTGDMARWYPMGDIECLGRVDNQVKIRGFRIELEEIESKLKNHINIDDAVVIDRIDRDNNKYLCAYIVVNEKVSVSGLREYLSKNLPNYMIPSYFVELDSLPLTPNGKINRKALPEPSAQTIIENEYVAPSNEIEEELCMIWKELLQVDKVGVTDNFFEIGGDSLDASKLAGEIYKRRKIDIPLSELYKRPTISSVSKYIINSHENVHYVRDNNIVFLKKGEKNNRHIFFIHTGNGEVEVFRAFVNYLDDNYNCWGIKFDKLDNYAPKNVTIEDVAKQYIEKIKKIQPQGPYYIIGGCIGGTIAFEIGRSLEQSGDKINLIAIIASFAPRLWENIVKFSVDTEKYLLHSVFPNSEINYITSKMKTEQDVWKSVVDNFEKSNLDIEKIKALIPENMFRAIPDYKEANSAKWIYYVNAIRTQHNANRLYFPKNKICTKIYYFEGTEDEIITEKEKNKELWCKWSTKPIEYIEVCADHFSIFEEPISAEISKYINKIL